MIKVDTSVVVTKLLARKTFIDTGKQFNILATAWIQFMVHDWMDHLEDTKQVIKLFRYVWLLIHYIIDYLILILFLFNS